MHSDFHKAVHSLLPQAGCISQLLILSIKVLLKSWKHFMNISLPTSFCRYWHGSVLFLLQPILIRGFCTVFLKCSHSTRWWNSKDRGRKIERSKSWHRGNSAADTLGTVLVRYSKIWSPRWPNTPLERGKTGLFKWFCQYIGSTVQWNIKRMQVKPQLVYKVHRWDSVIGSTFWK